MANIYDQFDEPAAVPSGGGQSNVYDQFDAPKPAPSAPPGQQISQGYQKFIAPQQTVSDRLSAVGEILKGVGRKALGVGEERPPGAAYEARPFGIRPSLIGMAQGLYQAGKSAATLPGDVYAGRVDPLSEEGLSRAREAAMLLTPTVPRVGLPAAVAKPSPTVPQLYEEAGYTKAFGPGGEPLPITPRPVGYKAPEVQGAPLQPPQAAGDLANQIRTDLAVERHSDVNSPKTYRLVDKLDQMPEGATGFSLENVEALRQQLGKIKPVKDVSGGVTNAAELEAAAVARDSLDKYIGEAFPEAASTLETARGNVAAAKRAQVFDRGEFKAELRKARTGTPVEDTLKAQMERILNDPAQFRGYSRAELMQMQKIVEGGGPIERGARAVERFAREEKFISPVTRPLFAYPIGKIVNYLTGKEVDKLNEMIRANSPLGRQMQGPLDDWSKAAAAQEATPNARNFSRLSIASRNLSNNLKDAGINLSPRRLIGPPRSMGASEQQ